MVVGAFRKFGEAIRGDDGRGQVLGQLKPIDTDAVAREFELDKVGAERGAREQPAANTRSLDAIEQKIVQRVEGEWSWHGGDLINNLRAYASRLISVSVQTELARLDLLARDTLAKFRSVNHRAEAELGPLREVFVSCRNELRDFQAKHRLKRSARNPARRWTTLGLLVLLIGLEAALNGFFFAKGAEFGLLGGIGTAIGISFVNIIFAFMLGLFPLRCMNHRNYLFKFVGLVITLAGLAALIGLHGFAAHYRDATAAVGEDRAMSVALQSLLRSPLGLADLNSFYLFGIGLLWAIAALWKGATFDDPYPRYGAHFRRAATARNTYSDEHAFLFEDLEQIKEETIGALESGIQRIPLFPQQAAQIRSQREAHLQNFGAYETSVETAANQLLARYRDANTAQRRTPAPSHFDTSWKLPKRFLSDAAVLAALAEPPTPPLDANAALDQLRILSRTVLDEYEALLSKYPHPTQMQE